MNENNFIAFFSIKRIAKKIYSRLKSLHSIDWMLNVIAIKTNQ